MAQRIDILNPERPKRGPFVASTIRTEDEARKLDGTSFIAGSPLKSFALLEGNLITGQRQYPGAAAARLVVEVLGR